MNCSEFEKLLDLFIDGELDGAQLSDLKAHAAECDDCRAKLLAAEQLHEILSHMDDDISVPLAAQAAWRGAVRAEAKRRRMRRIYSACGAVAAVCVLTLGVTAMLHSTAIHPGPSSAKVEADGISEDATLSDEVAMRSAVFQPAVDYVECRIAVEDVDQSYGYLLDVVAEYGGTVERETSEDQVQKVYVQIPGENAEDFMSAVDGIGTASDDSEAAVDLSAESIGFCVTIAVE